MRRREAAFPKLRHIEKAKGPQCHGAYGFLLTGNPFVAIDQPCKVNNEKRKDRASGLKTRA